MKKKILLSLLLCLIGMGRAKAADVLMVGNVNVPQGSEATLELNCQFETVFKGYQFDLELQEGLALVTDADGKPVCEKGFEGTDHAVSASTVSAGKYRFVCVSLTNTLLPMSGTLLKVRVTGAANLEIGTVLMGKVSNVELTTRENNEGINLEDVPFTITIGEAPDAHFILDENSTMAPAASDGTVDVRVKRTIKAGEWNTICLPFAMSAEQVKAAFGTDVELGDFQGYEVSDDGETIAVQFADAQNIEANHPYIIKVEEAVAEFTVDGVAVTPEEEPIVNLGTKRRPKAFVGNYVAGTTIENGCLFLSDNQFWYSVGSTKIKGLRAYFDFDDLLPEFEDNYAEVRAAIFFVDQTTGVSERINGKSVQGMCYDLSGRKVDKPSQSGVYIIDGHKILVK